MDMKLIKNWIKALGFLPKEGTQSVYRKQYSEHRNYAIEVDFGTKTISYGNKIRCGSKRTQNFSNDENFVVLECVDRLLSKGYKPENIELEKIWPAGHRHSGELDICVHTKDGSREFMLIECKTFGKEFDKEYSKMKADGGQLFTYFKFSNKADWLVLYASELNGNKFVFKNEIVKIEDEYRKGDAKDFYDRWNKLSKDNGIFEDLVKPYDPKTRALRIADLKEIEKEDSNFIFIQFLEILRHNVVSDKPNAFNKIFTLFLCKIYDEKEREGTNDELHFQWKDDDDHVKFQLRLTDLYKNGMKEFLEKTVSDFSEEEFDRKYKSLDEKTRKALKDQINELRLEKNNEFAIKEVFDKKSFEENAFVVKEVVELLQKFKIRYNRKHQYLSDFFELLLTTGLKQEAGQFFTPVPIAQFIVRSLPIDVFVKERMQSGEKNAFLPYIIDYAAGSGHFLTESMHLIQHLLDNEDFGKLKNDVKTKLKTWQDDPFDWAFTYIYGIEKDYRLVKVGKVGCYLHGDGLANVIHSDGLASFGHDDYKDKLNLKDKDFSRENKQFDVVVSNPPYSVAAFKNAARTYYSENDYELYEKLTDNSSEIECLFFERTQQLLRDGGVAGVILPSSMLSNTGIYSKTREMLLRYFEIIAIAELGSNTFMATGTHTVVLFLRRRNNYDPANIENAVGKFFTDYRDVTINGVERPISRYVNHVWNGLTVEDYISILKEKPSKAAEKHEMYKDYLRKFPENTFWSDLIAIEKEKLFYFILAILQNVVLVKSGEKDVEKRFLGYEFSFRRGSEGIHPIQRGKLIDECTQLFDPDRLDNPEKASTYIHRAFLGTDEEFSVPETLKNHVFQMNLADMLVFDRTEFQKVIQLAVKKKVKSKWPLVPLREIVSNLEAGTRPSGGVGSIASGVLSIGGEHLDNTSGHLNLATPKYVPQAYYQDASRGKIKPFDFLICKDGALTGKVALVRDELKNLPAMINEHVFLVRCPSLNTQKYLFYYFFHENGQDLLKENITGTAQGGLNSTNLKNIKIPMPPPDIQARIVSEIEKIEIKEKETNTEIDKLRDEIIDIFKREGKNLAKLKLGDICEMKAGQFVKVGDINTQHQNGWYPCYGGNGLRGYTQTFTHDGLYSLVGRQGALCGNVHLVNGKFHATEHALVVTPKLEIEPLWLYHKLISMNLNQYSTGTAQPGLSVINLTPLTVSLPSLPEQKKLVAKIEKLENEITKLRKNLEFLAKQKTAVLDKYL